MQKEKLSNLTNDTDVKFVMECNVGDIKNAGVKIMVAAPMYGGQCLHSENKIVTEHGNMSIKTIVDTKYSGKVMSLSKGGKFEFKRVIGHKKEKNIYGKKWVRVKTENNSVGATKVLCTDDHMCAYSKDIFHPSVEYTEANNMVNNFSIRSSLSGNRLYNKDQISVLIGTMLGDGTIKKTGYFKCTHSNKQREYNTFKSDILGGNIKEEKWAGGFSPDSSVNTFNSPTNAQTRELRRIMYDGGKKKIDDIIKYIDNISLAFWYMDDGYLVYDNRNLKWKPLVALCTDSFTDNEIDLLISRLKYLGVSSEKMKYKKYTRIKIIDHDTFFTSIQPYVHSSMEYKLPEKFKNKSKSNLNTEFLDYSAERVKDITPIKGHRSKSMLYDIEVEDNNNFIANHTLVHNCTGIFTKSTNDLALFCGAHGINLQFFYLFNESLITRARNYCVDTFMRSDCTHLMFIDSDIGFSPVDVMALLGIQIKNPEIVDVITGPYPKKCFHHKTKVWTRDGIKTISELIKTKYNGQVLSISSDGKFEYKNVIGHNVEPNIDKTWVSLNLFNWGSSKMKHPSSLIVTSDHEVAYVDNPNDIVIKYTNAENMKDKWVVQTIRTTEETSNTRKIRYPVFNTKQKSAFLGNIFGDAHIDKNGKCTFTQKNEGYSDYFYDVMDLKVVKGKNKNCISVVQFTNPNTKYLRELVYTNGVKTIKNVINEIDEVSLAHMYMDDGSLYENGKYESQQWDKENLNNKSWWYNSETSENKRTDEVLECPWVRGRKPVLNSKASLSSFMDMSFEDSELFVSHIKKMYNIDCSIVMQKSRDKFYPLIKFDFENTKKLCELIAPYVCEPMNYKLTEDSRNIPKFDWTSVDKMEYSVSIVKDVTPYEDENNSHLYDIGVADNHNLVVNDGLVAHNSISWEKIYAAVKSGKVDENPFLLEDYVGDFVFNPLFTPGTKTFTMKGNQPTFVSEAGTGFMLIPRKTFEEYQKAYPELLYKPDHVRTKDFDGSRKIMAYFDCEVDGYYKNFYDKVTNIVRQSKDETSAFEDFQSAVTDFKTNEKADNFSERYLSEDYYFCYNVRKLGMNVCMCPWIELKHFGSYLFGGKLSSIASIGQSLTASGAANPKTYENKQQPEGIKIPMLKPVNKRKGSHWGSKRSKL